MTPDDGVSTDAQQNQLYDVAPDGRFLINTMIDSAAAPITLLMNWQGGLQPAKSDERHSGGSVFRHWNQEAKKASPRIGRICREGRTFATSAPD